MTEGAFANGLRRPRAMGAFYIKNDGCCNEMMGLLLKRVQMQDELRAAAARANVSWPLAE